MRRIHEDRRGRCLAHYTTRPGLVNNIIYAILEDDEGRLWLSANRGLSRFSLDAEPFATSTLKMVSRATNLTPTF
ncbi:MAG: hypothetical protein CFK52_09200 [Chloracidobacterium sp. CP2_5A]|nr:MAG: hypothetical protein CFK52_09200 [Chloracidobacterium sp. CP2_5A]